MTTIEPLLFQLEKSEMASNAGSGFVLFLISAIAGYQFLGFWQAWNKMNDKVLELEQVLQETRALQESQSETITENDGRIREKKDYDETDEIQTGHIQAWHGLYGDSPLKLEIYISRSKESTIKKNQEWEYWNTLEEEMKGDESCTVRDFYLGNSNPDFNWKLESDTVDLYRLSVSDTLINGWDNTIHLSLVLSAESKQTIFERIGGDTYEANKSANAFLKKLIDENDIQWKKILLQNKNYS